MKKLAPTSTSTGMERDTDGMGKVYGLNYSDHHSGAFVRKVKLAPIPVVVGYIVSEVDRRTTNVAEEVQERMPADLSAEAVTTTLLKRDGGSLRPLSQFVAQEAQHMQALVKLVRNDLQRLRRRLAGHIDADQDGLEEVMAALEVVEVPRRWLLRSWGAQQVSPAAPKTYRAVLLMAERVRAQEEEGVGIGGWFASLLQRHEQLWRWIFEGPPCVALLHSST